MYRSQSSAAGAGAVADWFRPRYDRTSRRKPGGRALLADIRHHGEYPAAFRAGGCDVQHLDSRAGSRRARLPLTITTSNIPPCATFVLSVVGFTPIFTGFDLASMGAPGCSLYTFLDVQGFSIATGFPTSTMTMGTIPDSPVFCGLNLYVQSAALGPYPCDLGPLTSDAMCLTVGS